jgi:ketosteroid isomerase-like protein
MRLRAVRSGAAAVVLGFAVPVAAHGPHAATATVALPPSARAAAATVDAFHAALRSGNSGAAAALLADDALIYESGGAERSKAEYEASHLPADIEFSKAVREMLLRRSGAATASLAWVASEGRLSGSFRGKPVNRVTTETMVLRRTPTGWKIIHIHWSSAAAH